jgi:hypothetical protein
VSISATSNVTAKMSQTGEQPEPSRKGEVPMKRLLFLSAALILSATLSASPAAAGGPTVVNGGGQGTVDVDGTPFSQFGFAVTLSADGSVHGQFNCLMAGASEVPGFNLMAVRGQVTSVVVSGNTATFGGTGMLQTGNQGKQAATFEVVVTEGGPGVGTFELTVLTPFLDLPPETVLNGQITIH